VRGSKGKVGVLEGVKKCTVKLVRCVPFPVVDSSRMVLTMTYRHSMNHLILKSACEPQAFVNVSLRSGSKGEVPLGLCEGKKSFDMVKRIHLDPSTKRCSRDWRMRGCWRSGKDYG
jgi:hypothetical protein